MFLLNFMALLTWNKSEQDDLASGMFCRFLLDYQAEQWTSGFVLNLTLAFNKV